MSEKQNQLDPKIQQSLQILQMSNAQLSEYLAGKMMENPMIEMESLSPDDSKSKLFQRKMDWLEQQEEENTISYSKDLPPQQPKASFPSETLPQGLLAQLKALPLEPNIMAIAAQIIDNINDDGYITCTKEELLEQMSLPQNTVEAALDIVQSLSPRGVGAFSLAECLKLQLQEGPEYRLARTMLSRHLEELQEGRLQEVALAEQAPLAEVENTWRIIRE